MADITIGLGMTWQIGNSRNYIRPEIRIEKINDEGNISEQVENAEKCVNVVWVKVNDLMAEKMNELLGEGGVQTVREIVFEQLEEFSSRLREIEKKLKLD